MALIQSLGSFLSSWKFVLLFYVIVFALVYINRKKFQVENNIVFLYRTNFGIDFINRLADRHKEFWKIVGYTAIGVGFFGMLIISGFLIKGLYDLIFVPNAPATLALVIPGVNIPGSPISVPLYAIIALFLVILFHEFGHGVIARAHGLKIKNTGFGFFGPIPLAFVEPDEKEVVKKESVVQHSIFAAGPFFNVILYGIVIVITILVLNPLILLMVNPGGVTFGTVTEGYPAAQYGVEKDVTYTMVNGATISDANQFVNALSCLAPNQSVTLGNTDKNVTLISTASPNDASKGYLGVTGISTKYDLKRNDWWFKGIYYILFALGKLVEWIGILSMGIGLANLLPLGPVDGGRMFGKAAIDINGKKRGMKIWTTVTIITVITMIILLFVPIIKHLLLKI